MKLRNKTVIYVKGLKIATLKGVGGGADLRRAVRAETARFVKEGTEDYFEVVLPIEPSTKQPMDHGLIMMGSVEAALDFMDVSLARAHGSQGNDHSGTIMGCQEYVGAGFLTKGIVFKHSLSRIQV